MTLFCAFCDKQYLPHRGRAYSRFEEELIRPEILASGVYGKVRETLSGKYVVKMLNREMFSEDWDGYAGTSEVYRKFYREALFQKMLYPDKEIHFFTPFPQKEFESLFEGGEIKETDFKKACKCLTELVNTRFFMPKYSEFTLLKYVKNLNLSLITDQIKALNAFIVTAKELHRLHQEYGVIHCDLSPRNTLIDESLNGIKAYLVDSSGPAIGELIPLGSAHYLAPEQRGESWKLVSADPKMNVWSFSHCIYLMFFSDDSDDGFKETPSLAHFKRGLSACLLENPELRAGMDRLVEILETYKLALLEPRDCKRISCTLI